MIGEVLNELTYQGVNRKQRSITRLFPTFPSRVRAVKDLGGVRVKKMTPDKHFFRLHSGTKENVWYDGVLRFKDMPGFLKKAVADKKIWRTDGKGVDWDKLVKKLIYHNDIQVSCSCFTGDTEVKLLDGRILTLREIYKEFGSDKPFWVFASDENGDFVPAKATCLGITGYTKQLVEVTLDNGKKIKCTPHHLFRLRNGEYKKARDLQSCDSLLPLYLKEARNTHKYSQPYLKVKVNSYKAKNGKPIWKKKDVAQEVANNHKVVSIRKIVCKEPVAVYDLNVKTYHNFALAAGVYVHNCPAFAYYGHAYTLSLDKYDAKFTEPENRPPRINNPKQYGAICKHLQALFDEMPSYEPTISKWLKSYWGRDVRELEREARKPSKEVIRVKPKEEPKKPIKRRPVSRKKVEPVEEPPEEPIEEPEEEEPEEVEEPIEEPEEEEDEDEEEVEYPEDEDEGHKSRWMNS